jgi:hypothetical protein
LATKILEHCLSAGRQGNLSIRSVEKNLIKFIKTEEN